jgi:putative redox protein
MLMSKFVTCRVLENTQVQVVARHHSWIADEPPDLKGDDLGPNPFELMLAAVGTCTALEVSVLAAHAKVPLEMTAVDVAGDWVGEGHDKRYRVVRTVKVRGGFPDSDLDRIGQWAERCPVGRIVEKGADLKTEVKRV